MPRLELVSHHLCPYVQRAAIALAEKGVPFERTNIDLTSKPDWFVAISPLGKVPLLRVDDEVIFESSVICEYLDETLAPRLHPEDALARAKERAFMEFGSAILGDLWGYQMARDDAAFLAKAKDIDAKLQRVESTLGEGPWFRGTSFGFVDAVFAPIFRIFAALDPIRDTGLFRDKPRVSAWRAALLARPSVVGAVQADFPARLMVFLEQQGSFLPQAAKAS